MSSNEERDALMKVLNDKGAYCGECSYEDGYGAGGCSQCRETLEGYADAVIAHLAAQKSATRPTRDAANAALIREAWAYVPPRFMPETSSLIARLADALDAAAV